MPEKNQNNSNNSNDLGLRNQSRNAEQTTYGQSAAQAVQGGRGSNLTVADRRRGGENSASEQTRNNRGQFAGVGAGAQVAQEDETGEVDMNSTNETGQEAETGSSAYGNRSASRSSSTGKGRDN